jgi:hypothetical protein
VSGIQVVVPISSHSRMSLTRPGRAGTAYTLAGLAGIGMPSLIGHLLGGLCGPVLADAAATAAMHTGTRQ